MRLFFPTPNGSATCIVENDYIYFIDGWDYNAIQHLRMTQFGFWGDEWGEVELPHEIPYLQLI